MRCTGIEAYCDPLARRDEVVLCLAFGGDEHVAQAVDGDGIFGGGAQEDAVRDGAFQCRRIARSARQADRLGTQRHSDGAGGEIIAGGGQRRAVAQPDGAADLV